MVMTPEEMQQRLSDVLGTYTSVLGANTKSATALKKAEELRIAQLAKALAISKEDAEVLLKRIKQEEDLIAKEEQRSKAIADALGKTVSGLKNFATGALDSAQAAYTSQGAFTGASATLGLLGNTVKAITDVVSTAFSGIPIIGGMVSAADKATALVVDITTKVMQMQLENSQRYVDTYNALSKTGLTFGGSLEGMRKAAVEGGLSLEYYTKFVTTSAADLSKMGGGLQGAAAQVAKMGKNVTDNNKQLLVMYGSYQAVDEALARFGAQAASAGFDTVKDRAKLNAGAQEYLYRLKDLTELTGISADRLKQEEDERQQMADYQASLVGLGDETVADRIAKTLSFVGATLGPTFDKYGAEFFARNGQVISEVGLKTKAFGGTAITVTEQLVALAKNSKGVGEAEFIKRRDAIIEASKGRIDEENKLRTSTASLTRATSDDVVKLINTLTQGLNAGRSLRNNLADADKEILKRRKDAKGESSAEEYAKLLEKQNELKMQMDKLTADNLKNAADLASNLFKINQMLVDKFTPLFGTAVATFTKAVDKLLKMMEEENPTKTNNVNSNNAIQSMQTSAGAAAARNEVISGRIGKNEAKNILDSGYQRDIDAFGGRKFLEAVVAGDKTVKPVFGGPAATSEGINGGKQTNYGGLNLQGQYPLEAVQGGPAEQRIVDAVQQLSKKYPGLIVNAFNDAWHQQNAPGSLHTKGKAADVNIPGMNEKMATEISSLISGISAKYEKKGDGKSTGDHIHLEMKKLGGISNKPAIGGEAGPEAFVPLPDGRTIPVSMDNTHMVTKLQELIDLTRDHLDTSEKIHRAVA